MSEQKTYIGNGKEHVFPDGGSIVKLGFSAKDLAIMNEALNEKGYTNLVLTKRKEPSQYGDTHYMTIDTFKPKPQGQQSNNAPQTSYNPAMDTQNQANNTHFENEEPF